MQAFPCIFAILTDRNQDTYERLISIIQEKWNLNLTKAWVDCERSLRNAIMKAYPQIEVRAFWYQYCLAVRRKCKSVDQFFEFIWENAEANVLYHKLLCLALLPLSEIVSAFNLLKADSEQYEIFQSVVEYMEKVFMSREKPETFSIERNLFGKLCSATLKKKFFMPKKTTWLIDLILLIQQESIQSLERYESDTQKNCEDKSRQSHFIKREYDTFVRCDTKDIREFLDKLTFCDNTGSITRLDNYIVEDETEFADNYDGDYDNYNAEPLVAEAVAPEAEVQVIENCIVCLVNPKTTMLEPCNHLKFCEDCIDHIMVLHDEYGIPITPTCPYCRAIISGRRMVFF